MKRTVRALARPVVWLASRPPVGVRALAARARRQHAEAPAAPATGALAGWRSAALAAVSVLVAAASMTSFAESYRGLYDWAAAHGLSGVWAAAWPLQVDTFIAVGELALFVALADGWQRRSRAGAWLVTLAGLTASVAGNIGHVTAHRLADRATAAVPPLAAAAALAVGLGVLKRVVAARRAENGSPDGTVPSPLWTDAESAALEALRRTTAAGNPLSANQLATQFRLTRAEVTKVRQAVASESNGHQPTGHQEV